MSIPVRLIVSRKGQPETVHTDIVPHESLEALNTRLFPEESRIKWIFLGRTLEHRLPETVSADSTIHVVISDLKTRPPTPATPTMTQFDKSLLAFIYSAFAIFLALVWKRFHSSPSDFTPLSASILFAFTFIFAVAVVSSLHR